MELVATVGRSTDAESLRNLFRNASKLPELDGVLGVLEEEFVSSRIVAESHSSIVDLPLINVIGGRTVSGAAWHDNEYGFSNRLAEVALMMAGTR